MSWRTAVLAAAAALAPVVATAQPSQGPMTVERLHSGWLAAGEVKLTEVNGRTSELVGGQAGWVMDDTFFVGGGGYWLANGSRNREMAYGGLVLQWLRRADRRLGYGAKALVGAGQATLSRPLEVVPLSIARPIRPPNFRFREAFVVAEPEANVSFRLVGRLRLTGGVGYRFVASDGRNGDRLRGATGSLGLQIS